MECKNCGEKNVQNSLFCNNCGTEFEKCPVCQKVHRIKIFCPNSGKNIKEFLRAKKKEEEINKKKKSAQEKYKMFFEAKKIKNFVLCFATSLVFDAFYFCKTMGQSWYEVKDHWPVLLIISSILIVFFSSVYVASDENITFSRRKLRKFAKEFPEEAKYLEPGGEK
jgi:hypothetical protein